MRRPAWAAPRYGGSRVAIVGSQPAAPRIAGGSPERAAGEPDHVAWWSREPLAVEDADYVGLAADESAALQVGSLNFDTAADGLPAPQGRVDDMAVGSAAPSATV
jgi:hypothetical protein